MYFYRRIFYLGEYGYKFKTRVIQYSKKEVVVQKITTFDDRAPPLEFCPGSTIEKYSLAQHNLCSTTPQLHL